MTEYLYCSSNCIKTGKKRGMQPYRNQTYGKARQNQNLKDNGSHWIPYTSHYDQLVGISYPNIPKTTSATGTASSLAFADAGVKMPSGYEDLKDVNGYRIIISAAQMYKFMSTKYGALMTTYSSETSTNGIYIGLAKPGMGYPGHVTIIKPGFNSYTIDARSAYFWQIK